MEAEMRKITIISLVTLLMLLFSVNSYSQNVNKTGFSLGPGLAFATGIDQIGFSLKGVYNITSQWEVTPMFTYYLEKDEVTWYDLFLNCNYVFYQKDALGFFGSAGLTMTFYNMEFFGENLSGNETSLNLGGGMYYQLSGSTRLGLDLKYTLGDADHLFLGAQILFGL